MYNDRLHIQDSTFTFAAPSQHLSQSNSHQYCYCTAHNHTRTCSNQRQTSSAGTRRSGGRIRTLRCSRVRLSSLGSCRPSSCCRGTSGNGDWHHTINNILFDQGRVRGRLGETAAGKKYIRALGGGSATHRADDSTVTEIDPMLGPTELVFNNSSMCLPVVGVLQCIRHTSWGSSVQQTRDIPAIIAVDARCAINTICGRLGILYHCQ